MTTELITVLDVDTRTEAIDKVEACGECQWFKIGAQLFTRCGPAIVKEIQGFGKDIFLDLKYHDIPNTVAKAAKGAADMGASLFTLHASGGSNMIEAARESVEGTNTRILAVTVLTSLTDEILRDEIGVPQSAAETVARWAKLAVDAGAHGVVSSAKEIALVREAVGDEPIIVTPGIRPTWAQTDDQARVATPREAAEAGANYVVVGRPILRHEDPAEAVRLVQKELAL